MAEAVFDVEESTLDTRPVIAVKEDVFQSFAGAFWLVNEGATSLADVVVRYDLLPGKVPAPAVFPDAFPFETAVGALEDQAEIRVDDAFAQRGVNLEELDKLTNVVDGDAHAVKVKGQDGSESTMSLDEWRAAIKHALGPFHEEVGTVIGEVGLTESSSGKKHTIRFRAVAYVFNENRRGIPRPPSAAYHVELETTGSKYQRHVANFAHEIKPGEADRFLINVQVKQSSNHRFRVVFRNVDGQPIQSPWIRLRCFIPRTRRGRLELQNPVVKDAAS